MDSAFAGDETAPFFGPPSSSPVSGVWVASMGVLRPELVMKPIVPVVEAGVLGIYGLIIAVIISTGVVNPKAKSYHLFDGYTNLSSGLLWAGRLVCRNGHRGCW